MSETPSVSREEAERTAIPLKELAEKIVTYASERKAHDISVLDIRGLTIIADAFVLLSGTSDPQLKALYNGIREGMKSEGVRPLRSEGSVTGKWLLIDYGDIIVHIFHVETREFYDIDALWADAPSLLGDRVDGRQ